MKYPARSFNLKRFWYNITYMWQSSQQNNIFKKIYRYLSTTRLKQPDTAGWEGEGRGYRPYSSLAPSHHDLSSARWALFDEVAWARRTSSAAAPLPFLP